MPTLTSILSRTSYRGRYDPTPVPREHLRQLLEAGYAAPSGGFGAPAGGYAPPPAAPSGGYSAPMGGGDQFAELSDDDGELPF